MENHQAKLLFRRVWHSLMEWWHSVEGPSFATLKYQINVHFPQLFFFEKSKMISFSSQLKKLFKVENFIGDFPKKLESYVRVPLFGTLEYTIMTETINSNTIATDIKRREPWITQTLLLHSSLMNSILFVPQFKSPQL